MVREAENLRRGAKLQVVTTLFERSRHRILSQRWEQNVVDSLILELIKNYESAFDAVQTFMRIP